MKCFLSHNFCYMGLILVYSFKLKHHFLDIFATELRYQTNNKTKNSEIRSIYVTITDTSPPCDFSSYFSGETRHMPLSDTLCVECENGIYLNFFKSQEI